MKNIKILLLLLILMSSCDPPYILIVENHTEKSIEFNVTTREPIKFDSLNYSDSLIADELIKLNTVSKFFNKTLTINLIDSVNYQFSLNPEHEVLISPATIGLPFKRVSYKVNNKSYEMLGEEGITDKENIEIKNKPLRTTIVKINE